MVGMGGMSDGPRAASRLARAAGPQQEATSCGVIMPISETASRSEDQWRSAQTLLHRGITSAGFVPLNVWENTSTDRISERIIGNIFEVPIAVADISDLNPNVMLELGLRLASKKPTVVVAVSGSNIPFDIRDFHATFYPADMNMLGMEDFFRKLAKVLQEKHAASKAQGYTPFLGNVIVDVASPETREVGVNELLLSRLDEITARLASLEAVTRRPRGGPALPRPSASSARGTFMVEIDEEAAHDFISEAMEEFEIDRVEKVGMRAGKSALSVHFSGADSPSAAWDMIGRIASKHGGEIEDPF
jgi:hypothetical protein